MRGKFLRISAQSSGHFTRRWPMRTTLITVAIGLAMMGTMVPIGAAEMKEQVILLQRAQYVEFANNNHTEAEAFGVTGPHKDSKGEIVVTTILVTGELTAPFEDLLALHEGCHRQQWTRGEQPLEAPCIEQEFSFLSSHFIGWDKGLKAAPGKDPRGFKRAMPESVQRLLDTVGVKAPSDSDRLYAAGLLSRRLNNLRNAEPTTLASSRQ